MCVREYRCYWVISGFSLELLAVGIQRQGGTERQGVVCDGRECATLITIKMSADNQTSLFYDSTASQWCWLKTAPFKLHMDERKQVCFHDNMKLLSTMS